MKALAEREDIKDDEDHPEPAPVDEPRPAPPPQARRPGLTDLDPEREAVAFARARPPLAFLAVVLPNPDAGVGPTADWIRRFREAYRASDPHAALPMVAVFEERLRYSARKVLHAAGAVVFDPLVDEVKTPEELRAWLRANAPAVTGEPADGPPGPPLRPMGEKARKAAASYPPWSSPAQLDAAFTVLNAGAD